MTKEEARRLVRERERLFCGKACGEASERLSERFLSLREYAAARTVMAYVSIGAEPETGAILRRVLADGKTLCLPKIAGPGQMEARAVRDLAELVLGERFAIPEPPETAPVVPPEALELIVVPGAAFDGARRRRGRGGGDYDRFLPKTYAFTVGLAWEYMLLPEVPAEAHDVPVRCVLTEARTVR